MTLMMRALNGIRRFFTSADHLLLRQAKQRKLTSVSVYGAGELGIAVVNGLVEENIALEGWYDGSLAEDACLIDRVVSPKAKLLKDNPLFLLVASEAFADEIVTWCREVGYQGTILSLMGERG